MIDQKQKRPRTYARNRVFSRKGNEKIFESDSTFFLKLVIVALLGTLWIKFQTPLSWNGFPVTAIPAGFLFGLLLISRLEKYQSDRKIWYAAILVVTIISYLSPAGIVV